MIESKNLPAPYRTKCFTYGGTKFKSRGDCIECCYEELYRSKHGLHNGLITTANHENISLNSKWKMIYDKAIDFSCHAKCPIKCETPNYFAISVSDYAFKKFES